MRMSDQFSQASEPSKTVAAMSGVARAPEDNQVILTFHKMVDFPPGISVYMSPDEARRVARDLIYNADQLQNGGAHG